MPERQRIIVGMLIGAFGIRGEMKFRSSPALADEVQIGRTYVVLGRGEVRTLRCRSVRRHHEKLLVAFDGIDTPEAARAFAGCEVASERSEIELRPGEYFDCDLVGLRLVDRAGNDIGRTVSRVVHYPAQDCLVVEPGEALVPMIKAFIVNIDLDARVIATTLPDGLFD